MKKILSVVIVLALGVFFPLNLKANSDFRFDIKDQKIEYKHGMEHRKINGEMIWDGVKSTQYYNVLSTATATNEEYHLVSISNYKNNGWGMHSLATFIEMYEKENPHMEVMAGVNGDFYHINYEGDGINTHVLNYDVVIPGSNNSMALVTDSEGKSYFKKTVLDGNELVVYNKYNEIKFRKRVNKVNESASAENEVMVLFDNFIGNIPENANPIFVQGLDIKAGRAGNSYDGNKTFAKGIKIDSLTESKVPENHFVVVSNELSKIVENGDTIVFQAKIKDYENIMSATSTYASSQIVANGEVAKNGDLNRHPRTGIGLKSNGDVIFVVVDGRDRITPKDGVKLPELGHLMKLHGAVEAFNFDGGGSSTLMLRNSVESGSVLDRFDVLNDLSDGRLRSLSNGFLVVKGDVKPNPVNIVGIESRPKFATPANIYIDENAMLNFDPVEGAKYYEVTINGKTIATTKTQVIVGGLHLGENSITVRAKGTTEFSTSDETLSITHKVYSNDIASLLNLLKKIN